MKYVVTVTTVHEIETDEALARVLGVFVRGGNRTEDIERLLREGSYEMEDRIKDMTLRTKVYLSGRQGR